MSGQVYYWVVVDAGGGLPFGMDGLHACQPGLSWCGCDESQRTMRQATDVVGSCRHPHLSCQHLSEGGSTWPSGADW